jgi:uncharacterized membrane protein (UPF0182 family)
MRSNLEDAIYALFDKTAPQNTEISVQEETAEQESSDSEAKGPEGEKPSFEAVAEAVISEFEKIQEASSKGNWNEFGESMTALEKSVEELKKQIGK